MNCSGDFDRTAACRGRRVPIGLLIALAMAGLAPSARADGPSTGPGSEPIGAVAAPFSAPVPAPVSAPVPVRAPTPVTAPLLAPAPAGQAPASATPAATTNPASPPKPTAPDINNAATVAPTAPLPSTQPLAPATPPEPNLSPITGPLLLDELSPAAGPLTAAATVRTADLWDRIRVGLRIPNLQDAQVQQREQYYSTRPDYVGRMVERSSRYLYHIVDEVERRRLPTDLALLPFIESAFNPQAMSSAKASGMWQFMPATGRSFDLKQTLFKDDRRSIVASTKAALDYLERLYGMFGDWHLALAAYNWGEGNVQRAIERNRRDGLATDYLSLRMPRETRDYVPKLQAIENIIARPGDFGFALPELANQSVFTTVRVARDIDVDLAARLSGLPVDEFKALNPQMNKPVILAAGTSGILLPHDNAATFADALAKHRGPLASWTAWKAPTTMRPSEAANQVGMSESELREVNRIPAGMLVRAGSTLLVSRASHKQADVPEHVADSAMLALSPDAPAARARGSVRVKPGDTLAGLARRHKVSTNDLAQWNKLSTNARLQAGQSLVIAAATGAAGKSGSSSAPVNGSAASKSGAKATKVASATTRKPTSTSRQRAASRGSTKVAHR